MDTSKKMNKIVSTRIAFLEDGSLKEYGSGVIYATNEMK